MPYNNLVIVMTDGNTNHNEQAFVLHSRPYRNTSLILDIFSREHGRLGLIAKGARTPKSALYGVLQPFIPLYIQSGGNGELGVLYKAEPLSGTMMPQGEHLYSGLYLNELLMRLLHRHDPHPELFDCYQKTLISLSRADMPDVVLRYFEIQLLEELGYGLNLIMEDTNGATVQANVMYQYQVDRGPVAVQPANAGNLLVSGSVLLALHERTLTLLEHRQQAKRLMRTVLDFYLGQKPIKSRELYRQFRH